MLRLLLAESVTRDDLDDLAFEIGLVLMNLVPAADTHPAQAIYRTRDRQVLVHVIDDARAATLILVVQGPGEAEIAALLRTKIPVAAQELVTA